MRPESVKCWEWVGRLWSYEFYLPQGNNTLPLLQEGCFRVIARYVFRGYVNKEEEEEEGGGGGGQR